MGDRLPVLIVDDQAPFRAAMKAVLKRATEFELVGEAADGAEAVSLEEELSPALVLMDINMPGMNGIAIGRTLIHSGWCDAVVILTVYNEAHMIQGALRAGIRGYVLKVDAGRELAAALRAVIAGYRYLSRGALATWTKDQNRFTGDHPPQKAT